MFIVTISRNQQISQILLLLLSITAVPGFKAIQDSQKKERITHDSHFTAICVCVFVCVYSVEPLMNKGFPLKKNMFCNMFSYDGIIN